MDYKKLEELSYKKLCEIANKLEIPIKRSKDSMYKEIKNVFKEYETYKKTKIDKYIKEKEIKKTKDYSIYLVENKDDNKKYIMKAFKKNKSSSSLNREVELQKLASDFDIAPNIIDIDTVSKYIIMENMDKHINLSKEITNKQQKQIISILKKLDKSQVYHDNIKIENFMYKGDNLSIINFSKSKPITNNLIVKYKTDTPNLTLSSLSLVLQLKDKNFNKSSYELLLKYISEDKRSNWI